MPRLIWALAALWWVKYQNLTCWLIFKHFHPWQWPKFPPNKSFALTFWSHDRSYKYVAWDVLSEVANRCGMICPGWQRMAWDVLSQDVLSYILPTFYHMKKTSSLGRLVDVYFFLFSCVSLLIKEWRTFIYDIYCFYSIWLLLTDVKWPFRWPIWL